MPAGLPTFSMLFLQAFFYAHWRSLLRQRLQCRSDAQDFCLYALCGPCLAAQEAAVVDQLSGVQVVCWELKIVGEPLMAQ